jgi:hypothetical protein
MYVERPIISQNRLSMKMGIANGTIRLVIDTTNSRVCGMSGATVPAKSHRISAVRRPDLPLGARQLVQGYPSLWFVPHGFPQKGQPAYWLGVSPSSVRKQVLSMAILDRLVHF